MNGFSAGNRIDLLRTGDEYFPALEDDIDGAREEIHLESYIFADDPTGQRIARALAAAARRGVIVRVVVDGFGASNLAANLRETMESAGVHVLIYRPERWKWRLHRHRLRRLHRKLAVIDARVGYCGGINILDDRDGLGSGPPRFDFAVRIQGPIVADIHDAVRRLWMLVAWTGLQKREGPRMRSCSAPVQFSDGRRAKFVIRDNLRNRRAIENAYLEAIANARSDVLISSAYFLPGLKFRRTLREAIERGVRVRLLLQGRREYFWVHYASRALYGSLVQGGVEIYDYVATYLHAKVAVIDEHWSTVGSSNLDPFSLFLAREANIVIDDREFALQLKDSLESAIAADSVPVKKEFWSQQPWLERVLSWIAFGLFRAFIGLTGFARQEKARS